MPVGHADRAARVVNLEADLQRIGIAFHRARHHHAADAQPLADLGLLMIFALALQDFTRGIEQIDVGAQRVQHQGRGQRDADQHNDRQIKAAFTTWIHNDFAVRRILF